MLSAKVYKINAEAALDRVSQPAFHAVLQIGVDTDLRMLMHHDFYSLGGGAKDGKNWIGHRFSSPPSLPYDVIDPEPTRTCP